MWISNGVFPISTAKGWGDAQLVNCLLHKHGGLRLVLRMHVKEPGYKCSAEEAETQRSLGLAGWLVYWHGYTPSSVRDRVSKSKVETDWGWQLTLTFTCTHMHLRNLTIDFGIKASVFPESSVILVCDPWGTVFSPLSTSHFLQALGHHLPWSFICRAITAEWLELCCVLISGVPLGFIDLLLAFTKHLPPGWWGGLYSAGCWVSKFPEYWFTRKVFWFTFEVGSQLLKILWGNIGMIKDVITRAFTYLCTS